MRLEGVIVLMREPRRNPNWTTDSGQYGQFRLTSCMARAIGEIQVGDVRRFLEDRLWDFHMPLTVSGACFWAACLQR